jgi:hypothetical protein
MFRERCREITNRKMGNRSLDRRLNSKAAGRSEEPTALPCPPYVPFSGIVRVVEPVIGHLWSDDGTIAACCRCETRAFDWSAPMFRNAGTDSKAAGCPEADGFASSPRTIWASVGGCRTSVSGARSDLGSVAPAMAHQWRNNGALLVGLSGCCHKVSDAVDQGADFQL